MKTQAKMNAKARRGTRTRTGTGAMGMVAAMALGFLAACGPTCEPASLVRNTRVVGARAEVAGAPERATPMPGEDATVTWFVTAPGEVPALGWAFALCLPQTEGGKSSLDCGAGPLNVFQGTENPPRVSFTV